jgi:hypothetical protein
MTQFITTRDREGRNTIWSNYNNKARGTSRSCQIKNTREGEIKHIATGTYPQPRGWTTPSSSWRLPRWWRWPSVMVSPSGRVPEQAPDWFFVATEACGGVTSDLGLFLEVLVFIGGVGVGDKSRGPTRRQQGRGRALGGRPPPLWLPLDSSPIYFCSSSFIFSKKILRKFLAHSENFYFCTKNDTTVVLLKTASVRVSSNQIIPKPYRIVVNMAWILHKL